MAEEDKAREWRICRELMGGELALCLGRFSFPWLCAGSSPLQRREGAFPPVSPPAPAGLHGAELVRQASTGVRGAWGGERSQSRGLPQHITATSPRRAGSQDLQL